MDRGAKRAKKDKEDPLVRRREELILEVANARVAMKEQGNKAVREATESLMQALRGACADIEAKNRNELLKKLPEELWEKIVDDENVHQNDMVALALTCRFFREKQKDLGRKLETNLTAKHLLNLQKRGKVASHSLGWFRWVCDTWEILPGFKKRWERVKGAVYEGDLLNYAALLGSVEILRWLMEEKGWELNEDTGWLAGLGGSVEVLKYVKWKGYEFDEEVCRGAAREGHLKALTFLRGLDPPCPWDEVACDNAAFGGHLDVLKWLRSQDPPCPWDKITCSGAARGGHLDVLKWLRSQDPPCPWDRRTCFMAAEGGHLDILKWARSQDPPCPWGYTTCTNAALRGNLDVLKFARGQDPPCPWSRDECRRTASMYGHQHIIDWIDQREDESDAEYGESSESD